MMLDDSSPTLGETQISTLIGDGAVTTAPESTMREAAVLLNEAEVGLLVIGDRDDVQGVVSERDVVRAVATGVDLDAVTVGELGNSHLSWTTPESTVTDVIDEMMTGYLRHLLVGGDDGKLVGVVSMRDLLAAFPG